MRAPWQPFAFHDPRCFEPTTALIAMAALSAGGQVLGGIQQNNIDRYNSGLANQQANLANAAAVSDAATIATANERRQGEARADIGASGVDVNQGTPVAVMGDLAQQGELSRQLTLYRGAVQGSALRQQGELDKFEGTQALDAGLLSGATTVASGYARANYLTPDTGGTAGRGPGGGRVPRY